MARKSHRSDEEKSKEQRGPIQYPYVVYADYNPGETIDTMRWLILKFSDSDAAKGHINALIGDDEWDYEDITVMKYPGIVTSRGIKITLRNKRLLEEVMESSCEEERMTDEARYFKFRRLSERVKEEDLPIHSPVAKKMKAEKKEPREKVDRSGMVSANDIAAELKVEGREVRGVLRSMKLEKPTGGWWFDKKTAEEIRDKVRKGLKDKAKKK